MSSALSASVKGASFLIIVQVTSRALTFIINQVLLRYMSPALLGASTQLDLYSISVLYFARESLRVALQRQTGNAQVVVNVSYISILLGVPLAVLLAVLYGSSALPNVPYIVTSIKIYGVSALVELFAEPCFVIVQQKLAYKIRALAETSATIARCLVTFATVAWANHDGQQYGVLPFAYGQLAYATVLSGIYYIQTSAIARKEKFALSPRKIPTTDASLYIFNYLFHPICVLAANLYLQSSVKYILTQGDSLLIASLTTLQDQGAYALASNYGGLVARMLFQPIEESSRNLFAKLCAPRPEALKPLPDSVAQASTTLLTILRVYNLLALAAWSLGPSIAPLLLRVIAGSKWAETGAGEVLAIYCYYIPLLALNGVTEAFVAAVASNADLKRQSALMGVWSVAFALTAFVLLKVLGLGAEGLVWANCLNMFLRTVWNITFIKAFFKKNGTTLHVRHTLPTLSSVAAAIGAATVLRTNSSLSTATLLQKLLHDCTVAALFTAALLVLEREFIVQCYFLMLPRRAPQKQKKAAIEKISS